jgi:hypothetical protein
LDLRSPSRYPVRVRGEAAVIGVKGWRDESQQRLDRLLLQPARPVP